MMCKKYLLKVTLAENDSIYRTIEIDGRNTLDTLSTTILNAFEFDRTHLYLFSMSRKPYDSEGYYHPQAESGKRADKIRLDSLELKVRNKFLYLYDFGDEWMFHVTVKKIQELEFGSVARVVDQNGKLEQYPDYEQDLDEMFGGDIIIDVILEEDEVIQEKLLDLPAQLQMLWHRMAEKKLLEIDVNAMHAIYCLSEAGLLVLEEKDNYVMLKICRSRCSPDSYPFLDDMEKRYRVENALYHLVKYYGVIEQAELFRIFKECGLAAEAEQMDLVQMIKGMDEWRLWKSYTTAAGVEYVAVYREEVVRMVLDAWARYPVSSYRRLSDMDKELLCAGDWDLIVPVYEDCFHYFVYERYWEPEDVEELLVQVVKHVATGATETEYLEWARDAMDEAGDKMTKWTKRVLMALRNSMPSAALKGYSWDEYTEMNEVLST